MSLYNSKKATLVKVILFTIFVIVVLYFMWSGAGTFSFHNKITDSATAKFGLSALLLVLALTG